MRVLVDALNLSLSQGTGLATYARNVCQANQEAGNEVDILYEFAAPQGKSPLEEELAFYDPQYTRFSVPADRILNLAFVARQLAWPKPVLARPMRLEGFVDTRALQRWLPRFDRILTAFQVYRRAWAYFWVTGRFLPVVADPMPDVAHWTTPHPIYMPGARNVYTVHDVIPLKLPYTTLDNRRRYLGVIKGAVKHASRIISISETTTHDLLAIAPDAAGKISNTSQSIAPSAQDAREDDGPQHLKNLLGIEHKKFFLFLSAIEPKKNLGRLIEAFLASNSPYPLIIVGKKAWLYENELRPLSYLAASAKLGTSSQGKSRIVQLDYVESGLLGKLVRGARAVLFPSLYEGFGLPILEAMVAGTPIMTSNTGAMAEIAKPGTALLIDPLDIGQMLGAIDRLARDDDLCATLSAAGLARARDYGWDAYRSRVMEAYEGAVSGAA